MKTDPKTHEDFFSAGWVAILGYLPFFQKEKAPGNLLTDSRDLYNDVRAIKSDFLIPWNLRN